MRAASQEVASSPQKTFGEGDDGQVDAGGVHVLDAQVVVEVSRHRRHEVRTMLVNAFDIAGQRLDGITRSPLLFEESEPPSVEHVRVNVDVAHGRIPPTAEDMLFVSCTGSEEELICRARASSA